MAGTERLGPGARRASRRRQSARDPRATLRRMPRATGRRPRGPRAPVLSLDPVPGSPRTSLPSRRSPAAPSLETGSRAAPAVGHAPRPAARSPRAVPTLPGDGSPSCGIADERISRGAGGSLALRRLRGLREPGLERLCGVRLARLRLELGRLRSALDDRGPRRLRGLDELSGHRLQGARLTELGGDDGLNGSHPRLSHVSPPLAFREQSSTGEGTRTPKLRCRREAPHERRGDRSDLSEDHAGALRCARRAPAGSRSPSCACPPSDG